MDAIQTKNDKYKRIYGYRQIYIYIRLKLGKRVNHKRIYRLMNTTNTTNNEYVFNTHRKAINQVDNTQGIVFHSNRGFQYTNSKFKKILDENIMIQSMSRVRRCIDNGQMEGV